MDKVKKYQDVIIQFLQHYNEESGGNQPDSKIKHRILIDKENNSFQLLAIGWNNHHYAFGPIFHFDIIDGKIWMQCNNTEWEVVDYLMEHGVAKEDIVLGFIHPLSRHFSGFATA